jgi:hypothetical protein
MLTTWKIWVIATTETKARRLYARVVEWNDALVETLALGQRFAYGWCISGDVYQDPGASSDSTAIAGVVLAEWRLVVAGDHGQDQSA